MAKQELKPDNHSSIIPSKRFRMETCVSTVLGDLFSRSGFFIIDRCYRQQKGVEDYLSWLRHVLLHIKAIVEEAAGWRITNRDALVAPDAERSNV